MIKLAIGSKPYNQSNGNQLNDEFKKPLPKCNCNNYSIIPKWKGKCYLNLLRGSCNGSDPLLLDLTQAWVIDLKEHAITKKNCSRKQTRTNKNEQYIQCTPCLTLLTFARIPCCLL